ncbi:helix-turn-helix transcriptional regulator [Ketogulonicigenium vulgare]|uniref:helix-turn-helix transcriptional regulator n=1 Tax=Ketogulonicigenium vulgare TaxID=92945 RepID=UPI002358101D|nr:hypothetical protein [Ketogulonicigenium vulgare]
MAKQGVIQPRTMPGQIETEPRVIAYAGTKLMCEMLDVSETTLWEWVKRGFIPKPVRIGDRSNRWRWSDVEASLHGAVDLQDDPILKASRGR